MGDNTAQPFINKQGAVELGISNAPEWPLLKQLLLLALCLAGLTPVEP